MKPAHETSNSGCPQSVVAPDSRLPRSPAANALKHGFCATRFVSDEITVLAETIRSGLIETYAPQIADEIELIEELALEQARLYGLERSFHLTRVEDRSQARADFEKANRAKFEEHHQLWTNLPTIHLNTLGGTFEGASYLSRIWSRIVDSLAPGGPGITIDLAKQAAMASGSHWKIQLMNDQGAWVMTRFVRTSLEPNAEFRDWVDQSGGSTSRTRAQWYLDRTPDREASRREFAAVAAHERDRWALQANDLRANYETAAQFAPDRFMGVLPGDDRQKSTFRLNLRYLTATRNRVDRLRNRLDTLLKNRALAEFRASEKERRRLERAAEAVWTCPESEVAAEQKVPLPVEFVELIEIESLADVADDASLADDVDAEAEAASEKIFAQLFEQLQSELIEEQPAEETEQISEYELERKIAEFAMPGSAIAGSLSDDCDSAHSVPLRDRIEALARLCGVTLGDETEADEDETADDDGLGPPLTEQESREFEAWKRRITGQTQGDGL
jgi:hypothetical protein